MLKILKKRKITLGALIFLLIILVCALFAGILSPYDPNTQEISARLTFFRSDHLLGTDNFGRDILSRIIYGSQMSLLGALGIVIFSMSLGCLLGLIAGYIRSMEAVIMRLVDSMMVFPPILLAMLFITILGSGVMNVIIAVGIYYTTRMARVIYGLTLKLKAEVYITACRSQGAGTIRILCRHILTNLISPIIVQATFTFSGALLQLASLDYLGLGIPREIPTWGNMLNEGSQFMTNAPWIVIYPGLAIVLTVLAVNMLGDVLRDNADPKFRDLMKEG